MTDLSVTVQFPITAHHPPVQITLADGAGGETGTLSICLPQMGHPEGSSVAGTLLLSEEAFEPLRQCLAVAKEMRRILSEMAPYPCPECGGPLYPTNQPPELCSACGFVGEL